MNAPHHTYQRLQCSAENIPALGKKKKKTREWASEPGRE